jgi:hypothetical protein
MSISGISSSTSIYAPGRGAADAAAMPGGKMYQFSKNKETK